MNNLYLESIFFFLQGVINLIVTTELIYLIGLVIILTLLSVIINYSTLKF